jgi:hypothetical protein
MHLGEINTMLEKASTILSEDAAEDRRRASFRKRYPHFDALVRANEAYRKSEDGIPVAAKKGPSKSYLSQYDAHMLRQKGYLEKQRDSDWKDVSYFAYFTKKGVSVLRNLWDEWMDLAYED